jgi:hypothetical protein
MKYKWISCWVLVAHTCNPSYSAGRDQEDCSLKPAQANSLQDPISNKTITKKDWWSGSRWRPWVQTPVLPKKKKKALPASPTSHVTMAALIPMSSLHLRKLMFSFSTTPISYSLIFPSVQDRVTQNRLSGCLLTEQLIISYSFLLCILAKVWGWKGKKENRWAS